MLWNALQFLLVPYHSSSAHWPLALEPGIVAIITVLGSIGLRLRFTASIMDKVVKGATKIKVGRTFLGIRAWAKTATACRAEVKIC